MKNFRQDYQGVVKFALDFPKSVVQWVTDLVEFLVDHLHGSLGLILVKASPLMAPFPSAYAIFGALEARFGVTGALVMAFVFEGLGFAAVFAKVQIDQHNKLADSRDQADGRLALNGVRVYFLVSELCILFFECLPAWVHYNEGTMGLADALIHTAPLVFPIFSYVGANVYSVLEVLSSIRGRISKKADDALNELDRALQAALAEQANIRLEMTRAMANAEREMELLRQSAAKYLADQLAAAEKDHHRSLAAALADQRLALAVELAEKSTELRMLRSSQQDKPIGGVSSSLSGAELTSTERKWIEKIVAAVRGGSIDSAKTLAASQGWAERSTQRYFQLAIESKAIELNGGAPYYSAHD